MNNHMISGRSLPRALTLLTMLVVAATACQHDGTTAPSTHHDLSTAGQITGIPAAAGNTNGAAGESPAFYDGDLFTINLMQISDDASTAIHEHNRSFNTIYATNDLDDEQDFIPVIDAIQGDGFNPLWEQILIVWNPGFSPRQFHSDDEVKAAAQGANPEITLVDTEEFYRCSVVGAK